MLIPDHFSEFFRFDYWIRRVVFLHRLQPFLQSLYLLTGWVLQLSQLFLKLTRFGIIIFDHFFGNCTFFNELLSLFLLGQLTLLHPLQHLIDHEAAYLLVRKLFDYHRFCLFVFQWLSREQVFLLESFNDLWIDWYVEESTERCFRIAV